jgi:hypothetical protein
MKKIDLTQLSIEELLIEQKNENQDITYSNL